MLASQQRGSVLVVDDDSTVLRIVSRYLARAGYSPRIAADGYEALAVAQLDHPALVVLDVMLPGLGGLEVMRRLREREPVSVILLTAKGEPGDRVAGLQLGADDYVSKPFSALELVARVDAVLRRRGCPHEETESLEFGDLVIDTAGHRVSVGGLPVVLTAMEFKLLGFLARHPGHVFSRDELLTQVWNHTFGGDSGTVAVHIRRLRMKLELDPSEPRWLRTVWGSGYRFDP